MVLFTTEGCSYCDMFIYRSLGDPQLASLVQEHFDAVGPEIFNDAEMVDPRGGPSRVKEFAKRQGAGFSPTLLFYGEDGTLLHRAVGYLSPERFRLVLDYLIDGEYQSAPLRDYVVAREASAAPTRSDYELREDSLFGRPPDGRRSNPAEWYADTGFSRVPALLFFEETGKEVLSTDALVLRQRMMNSLLYTLEGAYEKDWTYQRFARSKGVERARQANQAAP